MNFHDLKIIVGQLKKSISCHKCGKKYNDEDLELIGGVGDMHTFFHAECSKCETQSMIDVSLSCEHQDIHPESLPKLGTSPRMGNIQPDEVLDICNFLKEFEGDFVSLFKTE